METEVIISHFINQELMRGESELPIKQNESLISAGILDSLALLKLLFFIEEKFDIKVGDGEVVPENFDTIDRITSFIHSKKQQAPPTQATDFGS